MKRHGETITAILLLTPLAVPMIAVADSSCDQSREQTHFICADDPSDAMCITAQILTARICSANDDAMSDYGAGGNESYDSFGARQTEDRVARAEALYRRSVAERDAVERPQRTSSIAESSTNRRYAPHDCARVSNGEHSSEIENICGFDIEAHWRSPGGSMNMWTIRAFSAYRGGDFVERIWVCDKNDSLDLQGNAGVCIDNW